MKLFHQVNHQKKTSGKDGFHCFSRFLRKTSYYFAKSLITSA
jgi:hypothetical protein